MSQEFQEFIIKTERAKRFIAAISKLASGHFQWTHFRGKDPTDLIFHHETINPDSAEAFKDPVPALEAMLEFIIKDLEKDEDKIEFLDSPGDCVFVSYESQNRIVKRLPYVFSIKIKGQ
jgi:hypothetical protein